MGRQWIPLCLIAVGLVSGCGSTSSGEAAKPASQILKDAQRAAASAISVHAVGHDAARGARNSVEISVDRPVGAAYGRFKSSRAVVEVLQRGRTLYLRGNRPYWRHFGNVGLPVARIAGKWVVAPASDQRISGFARVLSWPGFVSQFYAPGKVVNEGVKRFRGRQVIVLRNPTEKGALYVSATGKPYPLGISGGPARVTIRFNRWNQPVRIPGRPKSALPILGQ